MKIDLIEPGTMYAVAISGWTDRYYGPKPNLDAVRSGSDCVPGIVLAVGKYRESYQPCGMTVVESPHKGTATMAVVMIPRYSWYQTYKDGSTGGHYTYHWREDGLNFKPHQEWTIKLVKPMHVFDYDEFMDKFRERVEIARETSAQQERMNVLNKEISDLLIAQIDSLAFDADRKLVNARHNDHVHVTDVGDGDGSIIFQMTFTVPGSMVPSDLRVRLDERKAITERLACKR